MVVIHLQVVAVVELLNHPFLQKQLLQRIDDPVHFLRKHQIDVLVQLHVILSNYLQLFAQVVAVDYPVFKVVKDLQNRTVRLKVVELMFDAFVQLLMEELMFAERE